MLGLYKQIKKEIKKYDDIVIVRHIGADPDALGSQFALKELILLNFPEKNVVALGNPASRFKYLGTLDKDDSIDYSVGLVLNKKISDYVDENETLVYVHTNSGLSDVLRNDILNAYEIVDYKVENLKLIEEVL